jgi:hypothetical protein
VDSHNPTRNSLRSPAARHRRDVRAATLAVRMDVYARAVAAALLESPGFRLSSDPSDWDELISHSAGAEKYSRRLSERITEGYAAKFDQERDRAGTPPSASGACPSRRTPSRSIPSACRSR